jgi:hypothetical protein
VSHASIRIHDDWNVSRKLQRENRWEKKFNRNYSALSISLLDLVSVLIRGSNRCGVLVLGKKMNALNSAETHSSRLTSKESVRCYLYEIMIF